MEDELRGRVDVAERAAAAAEHPDLEEEGAQLEDRMAEPGIMIFYKARFGHQILPTLAALEYNVWSVGSMVLGYREMKEWRFLFEMHQEVLILFSLMTYVEYSSIPEAILRSIINNSLQPITIMRLSTEFSEGKTDKAEDIDFDSADIHGVHYLLRCFTIYCSILFRAVQPAVQTPLISALLVCLFGYPMVYKFESLNPIHFTYHHIPRCTDGGFCRAAVWVVKRGSGGVCAIYGQKLSLANRGGE